MAAVVRLLPFTDALVPKLRVNFFAITKLLNLMTYISLFWKLYVSTCFHKIVISKKISRIFWCCWKPVGNCVILCFTRGWFFGHQIQERALPIQRNYKKKHIYNIYSKILFVDMIMERVVLVSSLSNKWFYISDLSNKYLMSYWYTGSPPFINSLFIGQFKIWNCVPYIFLFLCLYFVSLCPGLVLSNTQWRLPPATPHHLQHNHHCCIQAAVSFWRLFNARQNKYKHASFSEVKAPTYISNKATKKA